MYSDVAVPVEPRPVLYCQDSIMPTYTRHCSICTYTGTRQKVINNDLDSLLVSPRSFSMNWERISDPFNFTDQNINSLLTDTSGATITIR
jgi:hypothetical protein